MTMEASVIGTNRDLKSMRRILNCRITELKQLAGAAPEQGWISDRLTTLGRERIAISATLVNRRTEAAKKVVDLSRWFNGNGALFSSGPHRDVAKQTRKQPLMASSTRP